MVSTGFPGAETEKLRLPNAKLSLPREDYAGTWDSPAMGEITVALEGGKLTLKTSKVEFPMTHWHLDTFLVEHKPWNMREFAEFRVGPDGTITQLSLFGEVFYPTGDSE